MSAAENPPRGAAVPLEHAEASANVKFAGELRRFLELGAAQLDAAMRESDSRVDKLAGAVTAVATDARELELQVQALESADLAEVQRARDPARSDWNSMLEQVRSRYSMVEERVLFDFMMRGLSADQMLKALTGLRAAAAPGELEVF